MNLNDDVSNLKGVGKKTKDNLNKLGIFKLIDLVLYFPYEYEYIKSENNILNINDGEVCIIKVTVVKKNNDLYIRKNLIISSITLTDGENIFTAKWFNQPFVKKIFQIGKEYCLKGKIQIKGKNRVLQSPTVVDDNLNQNHITPKYSLTKGVTNNLLIKTINNILNQHEFKENMPKYIIKKYNLVSLNEALKNVHNPDNENSLKRSLTRIKFQELFMYSLKIAMIKNFRITQNKGIAFKIAGELSDFKERLPFNLTKAQTKAVREILIDQKKDSPMNRLLQGDVGSGKTIIAFIAILNVVKNGYQAVMVAPTEILVKQHFEDIKNILSPYNLNIEILTSSVSNKKKLDVKRKIQKGEINIVIGTHALFQEDVIFENLGLVVTDEQHRFGVEQRAKLFNKNTYMDILVMSATPIPRTLALCMYGDLDISIIDELPPGRKKIDTYLVQKNKKDKVYHFALEELNKGRQVYIVCPLIEENENINLVSVEEHYEKISKDIFKDFNVEKLHGKMKQDKKDEIIENFFSRKVDILVSTTVIEVGVNVPNASIMIIEDAERFGLSQLHQLRGRVGRGSNKSYCFLIADCKQDYTKERMNIMVKSNDGFFISEQDLKLRGTGELLGARQHGDENFLLANPIEDGDIFKVANNEAGLFMLGNSNEKDKILYYIKVRLESYSQLICFN
ncbi:ATP-dependent DNA helicase RecG [Clostridium sp. DL1XJH146]